MTESVDLNQVSNHTLTMTHASQQGLGHAQQTIGQDHLISHAQAQSTELPRYASLLPQHENVQYVVHDPRDYIQDPHEGVGVTDSMGVGVTGNLGVVGNDFPTSLGPGSSAVIRLRDGERDFIELKPVGRVSILDKRLFKFFLAF